ncbi:MAG: hypothetical protein JNL61_16675 [Rhizobiaceae bacterium]|nr:hypothetical protein [Rhizobiaceae bacterium]
MIKFIAAGIWISAVTVAATWYSQQLGKETPAEAAAKANPTLLGGLDYVKTEVISVPVLSDNYVKGYFLTRLVYTVEPEKMKKLTIPLESLLTDEVYSYLYGNPQIDFSAVKSVDLDAFRNGLKDKINARISADLVHDVIIEQIDYLSKDDIRDNAMRRRSVDMKTPTLGKDKAAKPSH